MPSLCNTSVKILEINLKKDLTKLIFCTIFISMKIKLNKQNKKGEKEMISNKEIHEKIAKREKLINKIIKRFVKYDKSEEEARRLALRLYYLGSTKKDHYLSGYDCGGYIITDAEIEDIVISSMPEYKWFDGKWQEVITKKQEV